MGTVREETFELFRKRGMTTMFGNPGSTELPMLGQFPDDFRYVLGLQEAVVVGMADGYAQASGRAAHANLHTAPGLGNAMGAIFNAKANHSPVLITAGQQTRSLMSIEANLTNAEAARMPHPLVKWSNEVARAEDVPYALARAIHTAELAPRGPTFVSIPMDDWDAKADPDRSAHAIARQLSDGGAAGAEEIVALAERIERAENPVMVAGPDIDASGAWDLGVALAERAGLAVWASPAPGGSRIGFPESHPQFQGTLPPAIGPISETLADHDLIVVVGASVFSYYPNLPGPLLPKGAQLIQITSDPDEAARAPMGDAIVADVKQTLEALVAVVSKSEREPFEAREEPFEMPASDPISASTAVRTLARHFPDDGIVVVEAPSATLAVRNQLRLSKPGSWYFGGGGGLGFGLAASIGVAMAQPDRKVVCVLGEGSAQYAITGFWTAAAYRVPVTFLVLRNSEYAILKWFSEIEEVTGAPGLDLPGLDVAAVAEGYGVPSRKVDSADQLDSGLADAIAAEGPTLVEVGVAPGMALG